MGFGRQKPVIIKTLPKIREEHSIGDSTREWVLDSSVCPPLEARGVLFCGVSSARAGFRFSTAGWRYGQVLACRAGEGMARVGKEWKVCGRDMAYLSPPGKAHAYQAREEVEGHRTKRWLVAWVTYSAVAGDRPEKHFSEGELLRPGANPLHRLTQPALVAAPARPLFDALWALYREMHGGKDPAVVGILADLVHAQVARLVGIYLQREDAISVPLWSLWAAVEGDLQRPWTLEELAEMGSVSAEHLRRVCNAHLGHSPMDYLAHLRIRRAAFLIRTTSDKLEAIAERVGYANRFTFSTAFARIIGMPPGEYRRLGPRRGTS